MKILVIASLLLTGCATYSQNNASPEQRALAMQYLMGHQNPVNLYTLPMPQQHQNAVQPVYNCIQNYGSGPTTYACSR